MSKEKDEMIVKYTLMPYNDEEDYEHFFSLSLRELAKNTKDKSLLAPLIVYNSDLDVPMDNDLEEYTVYCNENQIIDVIRKQEINDVFRTLIIHGFDISMDELKETYIGIARRNNANLCINVIQDTGIDSNITLYIDSCIEKSGEDLWRLQKKEMEEEIEEFIKTYDDNDYDFYDYTPEELESVENFLEAMFLDCGFVSDKNKAQDKADKAKERVKELEDDIKMVPVSLNSMQSITESKDLEIKEDVISYTYENNDDIVSISCIDRDMFVINENNYEVALNLQQMEFIVNMYDLIIDQLNKPRS